MPCRAAANSEVRQERRSMETQKFIYYQDDGVWVGWFEDYPDYRTQGSTLEELKANLLDVYKDVNSGDIPHVRKRGELVVR